MRRLAAHYGRFRSEYPEDQLLIVFDIDGTILDMRHMVRHVLLWFDRAHGSDWFRGLTAHDVTVHENQVDQLLRDMALPAPVAERAYRWYLEQRWQPEAVLAAHRPYQGVLDVIRWFQIQSDTSVALNTGRPEYLRAQTLQSLNALGGEYRVEFSSELLHMTPRGWEVGVAQTKVAALSAFGDAGYRVFAVVDNEPGNIRAMAAADAAGEILFLHAGTLYESARTPTQRMVSGEAYDITALVSEREVPQHVQMVWHGVNDEWNLRQFLASPVTWGECDLRVDPLGRLVLRHDSLGHAVARGGAAAAPTRAVGCVRRARPGTQARFEATRPRRAARRTRAHRRPAARGPTVVQRHDRGARRARVPGVGCELPRSDPAMPDRLPRAARVQRPRTCQGAA